MTVRGVDYSWARPGGRAIREAGFTFAMRYVPYSDDGGKGLTRDELVDLHANGIAVGLVFETTAGRALEGEAAGRVDGLITQQALRDLGWPKDRPVYFAVDFDAAPEQQQAINDYLTGAGAALGSPRVGVYGGFWVVKRCWEVTSARWYWQTYAWSGGNVHPEAHIYQYQNGQQLNGGEVDYNEARKADFGAWLPSPAAPSDITLDDIVLALFAGKEQVAARPTRAQRLTYARNRVREAANGEAVSLVELVGAYVADHEHGGVQR